eukprot:1147132-Pelagomonas_calceolata.AAC.1
MDILLAGEDQSRADQPNSLAEGPPVKEAQAKKPGEEQSTSLSRLIFQKPYKLQKLHDVTNAKCVPN